MHRRDLDRYAFLWSELRLILAALALFQGGVPAVYLIAPNALVNLVHTLLTFVWIVSGLSAGYLLYRWYQNNQKVFGGKDRTDTITFLVLVISGLNLGFAGVFGANIGMGILSGRLIFIIVGIIYLYCAWHLWIHAKKRGSIF